MTVGVTTPNGADPGVLSLGSLGAEHGFTTRTGGVSGGDYASLNLGLSSGDERDAVERNRDILLAHLGVDRDQVCAFNQVHGDRVLVGYPTWFEEDADAAITDRADLLLVVSAADCFPVLFHDPTTGVVGAAHCGWRGTEARLVARVVDAMQREYGTRPSDLRVVVGPGIRGSCYQVSAEVATRFVDAGFPDGVVVPESAARGKAHGASHRAAHDASLGAAHDAAFRAPPDGTGGEKYLLDLEAAIGSTLFGAGVEQDSVEWLGRCTHCEPDVFFSHRRDAGRTGRLWGFVRASASVAKVGGGA